MALPRRLGLAACMVHAAHCMAASGRPTPPHSVGRAAKGGTDELEALKGSFIQQLLGAAKGSQRALLCTRRFWCGLKCEQPDCALLLQICLTSVHGSWRRCGTKSRRR